ncbi:MAG: hypothetical protein HWN68_15350 [Desulfobacterales bacterium]|nr:hypothetical protein [Desulfobacterales bacterium]
MKNKKADRNLPDLKAFTGSPSIEQIITVVDTQIKQDRALSRGVKLYFCHKYTGKTLREIGTKFDIGESGVSQASRRVVLKSKQDSKLRKTIKKIQNELNLSRM